MLNTIPRAKLHGLAHLDPLANYLANGAAKVALLCAFAIPLPLTAQISQDPSNNPAALVSPAPLGAQNTRYELIDLGTLGGTREQALAINNNGWVVGWGTTEGEAAFHAFLWRKGVLTDLGTLGGRDSQATSVNDRGEIVGVSQTDSSQPAGTFPCPFFEGPAVACVPFLWRGGIGMNALPTLGGNNALAPGINNRSQIVGVSENGISDSTCPTPQSQVQPVIWYKGQIHQLPLLTIAGDPDGFASAINDEGDAAGDTVNCTFSSLQGVLWRNGTPIDMGMAPLGGSMLGPSAINNQRQVTGTYNAITGFSRGFVWQDGVATDLGNLPGYPDVQPGAINNRGQIVGQTCVNESMCTSFIWENGVMRDLSTLVPANSSLHPFEAASINSRGEIVGLAIDKATGACCFAFLAIPENSTVAESTASAEPMETVPPKILLTEEVRKMVEQRHRYRISGF
jgi:probable HAF family extracellular repeat protein